LHLAHLADQERWLTDTARCKELIARAKLLLAFKSFGSEKKNFKSKKFCIDFFQTTLLLPLLILIVQTDLFNTFF
jgi:hypothetical protein